MKAILEFNLPEDHKYFELANNSSKLSSILYNLDKELRRKIKYESDVLPKDKLDVYEEVRKYLHQLMNENNIDLDMIC